MSNYILLKDIPDAKAGTLFELNSSKCGNISYIYKTSHGYRSEASAVYVENNPEWFREEKLSAPNLSMHGRVTKIVWEDAEKKEHYLYFVI